MLRMMRETAVYPAKFTDVSRARSGPFLDDVSNEPGGRLWSVGSAETPSGRVGGGHYRSLGLAGGKSVPAARHGK